VDKVIDGDAFWICDQSACHKIRLCGIDAPKLEAEAGPVSKRTLEALIADRTITCVPVGEGTVCDGRSKPTSYDRVVAQCFVVGHDIAGARWTPVTRATGQLLGGYYSQKPGAPCANDD